MLSDENLLAISTQLAKIIDNKFTTKVYHVKWMEISEKYQSLKKCESQVAPWVNTEI